jgi:outer membrane lipoprotein carrier protein
MIKEGTQPQRHRGRKFVKHIFITAFIFMLCISVSYADSKGTLAIPKRGEEAKPASEMSSVVDRIQDTFSGIKDIQGTFSQTSYIKDLEETQKYAGTFFIKKPSQAQWEYEKPRDEKIVINDTQTFIYKKAENQVIKTQISKEAYSQAPITLLSRFENIRNDFDISMPEENALQLVPKSQIGFIHTLVLETVPEGFPVKMFTILDTYGNIIMIELNSVKLNTGLKDDFFNFKIPEGAEVYDMNQ